MPVTSAGTFIRWYDNEIECNQDWEKMAQQLVKDGMHLNYCVGRTRENRGWVLRLKKLERPVIS